MAAQAVGTVTVAVARVAAAAPGRCATRGGRPGVGRLGGRSTVGPAALARARLETAIRHPLVISVLK
jgi:hypothetical protein